jgi:phage shock protein PspC (stress-responsive transcriptional regulator)
MQDSIQERFLKAGLIRVTDGRILGGVVAGLGRHYGLSPWRARLVFVLALMVIPGSQLLVYPILWILMPDEGDVPPTRRRDSVEANTMRTSGAP